MLFSNLKKSLFVGALLTVVSTNFAFAAEAPTTKDLTDNAKSFSVIDEIFDIDDLEDLEDLKDLLRRQHRHHDRHDCEDRHCWEDRDDWDEDDIREHRHEIRQERKERIEESIKKLSYSQRRAVEKFIARDREFHQERKEALRKMTKEQRQAVHAHYYGHQYHRGHYDRHGCHNR